MVSEATIQTTLFDELAGMILESRSGEFAENEDREVRAFELESGDELFPAMAWI